MWRRPRPSGRGPVTGTLHQGRDPAAGASGGGATELSRHGPFMLRGGLLATHLAGRRSLVRQLRGSSSGRQFAGGGAGARAARAVGDGRWWLLAAPPSPGRRHGHGRGRRLRTRTQTKREAGRGPSGQSLPSDSRRGSGPARSSHQVNLGRCGNLTKLHYLSQLLGGSLVQERSTHRDAVGITSSTEAPAPVLGSDRLDPADA